MKMAKQKSLENFPEIKISWKGKILSKIFAGGTIKLRGYIMDISIPIEEPERFFRKIEEYHQKYAAGEIKDFVILSRKGAVHISGDINKTVEVTDRRPHYHFYIKLKK